MENRISFFSKLSKSIYDFSIYKNFIRQSAGKAVVYLILLSLLLGGIGFTKTLYDFNNGIGELTNEFAKNVPEFIFENGQLDVKSDTPIVFEEDHEIIIIDTTGKTDVAILDQYQEGILILRDKFVQKEAIQVKTIEFTELKGFTITKDMLINWIPYLKWLSILIVIFGFIYFFISKMFSILFISMFGIIANNVKKAGLIYRDLFIVSVYTMTLPISIKVTLELFDVHIPYFWFIYHGIAVFYLMKVISVIKAERVMEQQMQTSDMSIAQIDEFGAGEH